MTASTNGPSARETVGRRTRTLILSPAPLARSPRARKQVIALQASHEVVTASRGESPFPGIEHIRLPEVEQRWGLLGRLLYLAALTLHLYPLITWLSAQDETIRRRLGDRHWDLVIAHDVQTATVAQQLRSRRRLVDLHEYAPRQNEHSLAWRMLIAPYFRWILRGPVRRADATTTVSQGIVDEYRREFDLNPTLIINATPYQDRTPTAVHTPIRLVHSGVPAVQRRLEVMIDAVVATSADVTLDFFLVEDQSPYMTSLRERARGSDRIRFNKAVPYAQLVDTLGEFDLGLSIFAPTTFNLAWCLPNKFFDYIQARLGVVVGPSPEMKRLVDEYGVGAVLPDFEATSLTEFLDALDVPTVMTWKAASEAHAYELSNETQIEIWSGLIDSLLEDYEAEGGP